MTHPFLLVVLLGCFVKKDKEKFGRWLSPRVVLLYHQSSGIVKVPCNAGRAIYAAFEDVRLSTCTDDFAKHISETNDQLSAVIEDLVINLYTPIDKVDHSTADSTTNFQISKDEKSFESSNDPYFDHDDEPIVQTDVKDQIDKYWPLEDQFYSGTVKLITDEGQHIINYDYGHSETLQIVDETWRSIATLAANLTILPSVRSNSSYVLK